MVYCDVNVHFVNHNFTLYLNKLCVHSVRCVQDTARSTVLSIPLAPVFFSSLKMC